MSLTVVNLQRKVQLNTGEIRAFVESLPRSIEEASDHSFSVAFISDRRMKELNRFFRGKDSTTDVLSFPHEPDEFVQNAGFSPLSADQPPESETQDVYLGDIVISVEQAQKQAAENGLTLENEIKQLILHGLLHLCGHDHETDAGEMNKLELKLRRKLKI
ncbi:MAG TPA: rRNA maturation RNase YbeY [Pyrinomonadaceae bacterium]